MRKNYRYYNEEQVLRIIHDGAAKCRLNVELSKNEDHIDGSIGMCNVLSNTICKILNNEDYRFFAEHWNIHRGWCKKAFGLLQSEITELDARITIKKEEIANNPETTTRVGFNS